jgi:hypothetical protein
VYLSGSGIWILKAQKLSDSGAKAGAGEATATDSFWPLFAAHTGRQKFRKAAVKILAHRCGSLPVSDHKCNNNLEVSNNGGLFWFSIENASGVL